MENWSRFISEALERDGRTLQEIAARIGVHESYLSRIKRGAVPSRAVLEALIHELDLDPQRARSLYEEALKERERASLARKRMASLSLIKLGTPREEVERFFRDPRHYQAALTLLGKSRGEELTPEEKEALYAILKVLKEGIP
ncbi:MAG TPA: XRE family transcriptional regulator [Candidatus Acetothermia bacterium]|mgnify:CR=1 FL=1|nr:XRE family transcriptional regulator [Candidatus Acetothermia bacterium]